MSTLRLIEEPVRPDDTQLAEAIAKAKKMKDDRIRLRIQPTFRDAHGSYVACKGLRWAIDVPLSLPMFRRFRGVLTLALMAAEVDAVATMDALQAIARRGK